MAPNTPWLLALNDLRRDLPFFGAVGFICGLVQWVGYRYLDKADWGSRLLQEHIAFNSLLLTVLFLWLVKGLMEYFGTGQKLQRTEALVTHVSARAIAFASVAASVLIGFAFAAASFGDIGYSLSFLFFSCYFIAIAEIAANPVVGRKRSRLYVAALSIIIGMPFAASFLK